MELGYACEVDLLDVSTGTLGVHLDDPVVLGTQLNSLPVGKLKTHPVIDSVVVFFVDDVHLGRRAPNLQQLVLGRCHQPRHKAAETRCHIILAVTRDV